MQKFVKTLAASSTLFVAGVIVVKAATQARQVDPVFSSIMSGLTSATSVPVLLPASMPELYASHPSLYASVSQSVTGTNAYEVLLDDEQSCNHAHACAVASFLGEMSSTDSTTLGTVKVTLANGVQAYFTPGQCGSSCGASRLDWISGQYRYAVFTSFEPTPAETTKLANSMITGVASTTTASGAIAMGFSGYSKGAVFYPTYGQEDLGSGEGYPASLRKYIRIDTVLSNSPNTAEWVECGDVNGYVGTSSQNQRWSGHFYAWHTRSGGFGEMVAGTNGSTGQQMAYCSDNSSTGWDYGVSGTTIATITAVSSGATGARVGAYLDDTGSGAIQYRSGTADDNILNINSSGYVAWPSTTAVFLDTFPDTSTTAQFDATSGDVTFSHGSAPQASARHVASPVRQITALPRNFPKATPESRPVLEPLPDRLAVTAFAGLSRFSSSDVSLVSERMDAASADLRFMRYDVQPSANVWVVTINEKRPVITKLGTFEAGSTIHYIYEASTGQLLGFVGSGSK